MSYELERRLIYLAGKQKYVPVYSVKYITAGGSSVLGSDILDKDDAEDIIKKHVEALNSFTHFGVEHYDSNGKLIRTWRMS